MENTTKNHARFLSGLSEAATQSSSQSGLPVAERYFGR